MQQESEALFIAIYEREIKDAKMLINEHPLLINSKDKEGSTPLHIAALKGSLLTAKLLIKKGADVNARDNDNRTPLFYAFPGNLDYDMNCVGQPSHKTYLLLIRTLLMKGAIYEDGSTMI